MDFKEKIVTAVGIVGCFALIGSDMTSNTTHKAILLIAGATTSTIYALSMALKWKEFSPDILQCFKMISPFMLLLAICLIAKENFIKGNSMKGFGVWFLIHAIGIMISGYIRPTKTPRLIERII